MLTEFLFVFIIFLYFLFIFVLFFFYKHQWLQSMSSAKAIPILSCYFPSKDVFCCLSHFSEVGMILSTLFSSLLHQGRIAFKKGYPIRNSAGQETNGFRRRGSAVFLLIRFNTLMSSEVINIRTL